MRPKIVFDENRGSVGEAGGDFLSTIIAIELRMVSSYKNDGKVFEKRIKTKNKTRSKYLSSKVFLNMRGSCWELLTRRCSGKTKLGRNTSSELGVREEMERNVQITEIFFGSGLELTEPILCNVISCCWVRLSS